MVTGATGFVGSHLTAGLRRHGVDVTALIREGSDPWRLRALEVEVEADQRPVDLVESDVEALSRLVDGADSVFHLAAAGVDPREDDPATLLATNVGAALNVLQAAVAARVRRVVLCGSCFEYGSGLRVGEDAPLRPATEYGATKAAAWLVGRAFARRHPVEVTALRPFSVYGPLERADRLVPHVVACGLAGRAPQLTAGDQERDFVFVDDVVEALATAATAPAVDGEVFNVCTGTATSVRRLAEDVVARTGSSAPPQFGRRPLRATDDGVLTGDPAKALDRLGWVATTPLRDGLARTIDWATRHPVGTAHEVARG